MTDTPAPAPAPTHPEPAPAPAAPAPAAKSSFSITAIAMAIVNFIKGLWAKLSSFKILAAFGKGVKWTAHWGTLLTGLQHAASAVYISLKDWHVAVFWLVMLCGTYWYADYRAEKQWWPVAVSLTDTTNTLKTTKVNLATCASNLAREKEKPACATPASPAVPTAAPATAAKAKPHLKKRPSSGFWGSL